MDIFGKTSENFSRIFSESSRDLLTIKEEISRLFDSSSANFEKDPDSWQPSFPSFCPVKHKPAVKSNTFRIKEFWESKIDCGKKLERLFPTPPKATLSDSRNCHEQHDFEEYDSPDLFTPANTFNILTLSPLEQDLTADDQYSLSSWNDSDEEEEDKEEERHRRRAKKRVPAWCLNWRETVKAQVRIDPDTVFLQQLPKCDLTVIFGYGKDSKGKCGKSIWLSDKKQVAASSSFKKRSSESSWGPDRLTESEMADYRLKMGQNRKAEKKIKTP